MADTERAEYARVDLSPKNPFGLTFRAPDKNRSLFIEEPQSFGVGTSKESQDLLRTLMVAHLVARHFPKSIETNFPVDSKIFLDKLYEHYGFKPPIIKRGTEITTPEFVRAGGKNKEKVLYANAHSGGLDSIYRVAKLVADGKKVMGGVQHAACMPNVSFFLTCVSGSYVLVSTACGGIMWVIAFLVGLYAWAKKEKKD